MDELRLEVLWIDDEPTEAFKDEAFDEGINITNCACVNEGLKFLNDSSKVWDAIILDANCKISGNEVEPDISALYKAIKHIFKSNVTIPWFVYTAKSMDWSENLRNLISDDNRIWDDRDFYNKPTQRYELFANIKKAVENRESFMIRQKYAVVCGFYKGADLVELLRCYDSDDFSINTSIPNKVRQIIEWVMRYFDDRGLLPIAFTGTNIAKCSSSLGDIPQIVPIHVARSMHFCVDVCNNGSHSDEIAANIVSGDAPYLNRSLILNLLNILQWCPSLQKYEVEEWRKKVAQCQQETREKREKRNKNQK